MKINKNIVKNSRLLILILISIVLNLGTAFAADPPTTINFQGYLTDSSSSAISGTKDIQISVYEAATGGSATYVETHSSVTIDNGRFSVSIGGGTASTGTWPTNADFTKALWLEITIDPSGDNETLSSRIPLTPAPYAQISINDSLYSVEKAGCNSSQYVKRNSSDNGWECADLDVTLTGTETLTNKTLTTPVITLEQAADVSGKTGQGQISWDTNDKKLYIGDGSSVVEIGAGGVGSSVESSEITDNTIVNDDIKSDAAIAFSKLAGLTSANILVGNGSNVPTAVDPSGDVEIANDGTTSISSGVIVNDDINSSAAIAFSKLAGLTSANILVGNGSNVPTAVDPSGDVEIANDGTTSISSGVIVNADIKSDAAIDFSKLASLTSANILIGNGSNVPTAVDPSGDVEIANDGTTSISSGVIVNADVSSTAAIATSKLSENLSTLSSATTLSSSHIGVILASGTTTLTLPSPTSGYKYTIKNAGSNTITISPDGNNIDGSSSNITLDSQYDYVTLVSDGSNWFKVAESSSGSSSGSGSGFTTVTASGDGEVTAICSSGNVLFGGCYATAVDNDHTISRSFAADADGAITGTDSPNRWTCHFRDAYNGGDVNGTAYVTCR